MNTIFVVLSLLLLLPYIFADDDDDDDDELRLIAVRTLLLAPDSTPLSVLEDIDVGMDSITDTDDRRERQVEEHVDTMDPHSRHLRLSEKERRLRCSTCTNYPSYYKGCWVKFVWTPKCRARSLIVHRTLSDEAIANLDGKELRRYLQNAEACSAAIDDMDDAIDDAITQEIVPPLPVNASFVEECIFEEIDD